MLKEHSAQGTHARQVTPSGIQTAAKAKRDEFGIYTGGGVVQAAPEQLPTTLLGWSPKRMGSLSTRSRRNLKEQRKKLNAKVVQIREALQLKPSELLENQLSATLQRLDFIDQRFASDAENDETESQSLERWMNYYADADPFYEPFGEYITAARYHAVHGEWPSTGQPNKPSFSGLETWRIKWIKKQHLPAAIPKSLLAAEELVRDIAELKEHEPLPVQLTDDAKSLLHRLDFGLPMHDRLETDSGLQAANGELQSLSIASAVELVPEGEGTTLAEYMANLRMKRSAE